MCPQCGSPLFYIADERGDYLFFHVALDCTIKPTKPAYDAAAGRELEEINCSSCSWKGPVRKLKKVFIGM
jgi:hypothetical protein